MDHPNYPGLAIWVCNVFGSLFLLGSIGSYVMLGKAKSKLKASEKQGGVQTVEEVT